MNNNIKYISSGNSIVDQLGQFDITGDVTPSNLYRTIIDDKGNCNHLAVDILSNLIYWYRPKTVYDASTDTYKFEKRFKHPLYVQKYYRELMSYFNTTEGKIRKALHLLIDIGVIVQHTNTEYHNGVKYSNVQYLELVPDVLFGLIYEDSNNGDHKIYDTHTEFNTTLSPDTASPSYESGTTLVPISELPCSDNQTTNTENTSENNTNNTTTTTTETGCGVYSENVLSLCRDVYPDYEDDILNKFLDAANGDVMKVINSSSIYNEQKDNIKHPISWIITCIKKGYEKTGKTKSTGCKINHGFKGREYDYDELEKILFNNTLSA